MRRLASALAFLLAFELLLVAIHTPYLRMPYHWDELGQFVPASLDLFYFGAWIPKTTAPNIHPPGLMALLAGVWGVTGYSIFVTRLVMLSLAALGALFAFLLAIRLGRGTTGAPAFAAVLFLLASPLFYTQSMMVLLDAPAMMLTSLALLLYFERRFGWCAAACVALVLVKETGATTPLVLGSLLWLRDGRRKEALYFAVPFFLLGAWLVLLRSATGYWTGNPGFAQVNVADALRPAHIAAAVLRNLWVLFGADGKFLGAAALYAGWRLLRGPEWQTAACVAMAQFAVVTLFGGALLERYLLPLLPIVLAAMAVAASAYPAGWRWVSHSALIAFLVAGWFWNPPYPGQMENLSVTRFVQVQQEAARYLEAYRPYRRVASAWPFTEAISRPEFGYVERALPVVRLKNLDLASIADVNSSRYDVLVVYSRSEPLGVFETPVIRTFWQRFLSYPREATEEQIHNALGLNLEISWNQSGHTLAIYSRD